MKWVQIILALSKYDCIIGCKVCSHPGKGANFVGIFDFITLQSGFSDFHIDNARSL